MQDLFRRFGLNPKETTAFLELLRLGETPVSQWAKHAGFNRSSMYVIMEKLVKAALAITFTHQGVQHVQAVPLPETDSSS